MRRRDTCVQCDESMGNLYENPLEWSAYMLVGICMPGFIIWTVLVMCHRSGGRGCSILNSTSSQYSAEESIFLRRHPYIAPILIGDLQLSMNVTAAGC